MFIADHFGGNEPGQATFQSGTNTHCLTSTAPVIKMRPHLNEKYNGVKLNDTLTFRNVLRYLKFRCSEMLFSTFS